MPLPARIANAPELLPGLELFYLAFLDLTSCRVLGYSEGPIRWLDIDDYARRKQYRGEQHEDLLYFISVMDSTYLEFKTKKYEAVAKPKKGRT